MFSPGIFGQMSIFKNIFFWSFQRTLVILQSQFLNLFAKHADFLHFIGHRDR